MCKISHKFLNVQVNAFFLGPVFDNRLANLLNLCKYNLKPTAFRQFLQEIDNNSLSLQKLKLKNTDERD